MHSQYDTLVQSVNSFSESHEAFRGTMTAMQKAGALTGQLRLYSSGCRESADALFRELFPRLREIASRKLVNQRSDRTAEPAELVNETWLTRLGQGGWQINNREHFFALAGLAMEQVLIDLARQRLAKRNGSGAMHLSLQDFDVAEQSTATNAEQVLAIATLMEQLEKADPETAMVVRGHYFMGLGFEEVARGTGLTLKQVRNRWDKGRLWLAPRLASRLPEVRKRSRGRE